MRFSLSFSKSIFIFTLCLTANNASGLEIDCFEQSPNLHAQGKDYYDLTSPVKLNSNQSREIIELVSQLTGKWQGTVNETSCKGTEHSPKSNSNTLSTQVEFQTNAHGHLLMRASKKGYADRVERNEKIQLINAGNLYAFDLKDNQLLITEKYRLRTTNQTSRLVEYMTELRLINEQLEMIIHYFSNGVFVQAQQYNLSKE